MLVEMQVIHRVVRLIGEKGEPCSGFILDIRDKQYLITVAHTMNNEREERILLQHHALKTTEPLELVLSRSDKVGTDLDIAIFHLPEKLPLEHLTLPVGADGLALSQEVFILGFPAASDQWGRNLSMQWEPYGRESALIKRGIFSGASFTGDGQLVYVDTIANPGFSGGLAVYENLKTHKQTALGVVKGHYSQPMEESGSDKQEMRVVAGITAITMLDDALKAAGIET